MALNHLRSRHFRAKQFVTLGARIASAARVIVKQVPLYLQSLRSNGKVNAAGAPPNPFKRRF